MTSPLPAPTVLVKGAGPAGAAAACHAARAGLGVVVYDPGRPVPPHDVMVSDIAAGRLAGLGVDLSDHPRIAEFELCFPAVTRTITGSGALVMDAGTLRARLMEAAIRAGAEFTRESPGTSARHVVVATGAPDACEGFACAGRFGGIGIKERILLAPVTPAADPRSKPAMVTVLPGGDGTATVWLARLGAPAPADPGLLLAEALAGLAEKDNRFDDAHPLGPALAGPLPAGFSPQRLGTAGDLIVGDAAGLVNPFTGEGLGAALLSGRLAAEAIVRNPEDPDAAQARYAQHLTAEYIGYFETARHAARRYHLVWRMLEAAAGSDHVFLTRARRTVLLPEGTETVSDQRVPVEGRDRGITGPFLFGCDEVQIATLRVQWPFLARLLVSGSGFPRHRLRSGLLFLAGLLASGGTPAADHAIPAAAIELATLGTLAFHGAEEDKTSTSRSVDWAGATLVLAGDFLLSQGSRLIAESAPDLSYAFADWLAELAELRAGRLDAGTTAAAAVQASLMEFPARTGALLGGSAPEVVATMRGIGNALGEAFAYAEDVLALSGQRTRLDATLDAMVAARTSTIPDVTSVPPDLVAGHLADLEFKTMALTAARRACTGALDRARGAVASVPGQAARRILLAYATAIEPADLSNP